MGRRTRRPGRIVALAVAGVLGLAACGAGDTAEPAAEATGTESESESEADPEADPEADSDSDEPAEEPAEPAAPATVERARFCDDLDVSSYAGELGVPPASLELNRDLEPGRKYRPYPGADEIVAESWACSWAGTTGGQVTYVHVSIGEAKATAASVAKSTEQSEDAYRAGEDAECATDDSAAWGSEGTRLACSRPQASGGNGYQSGYSQVLYRGLFDDTQVSCNVGVSPAAKQPDNTPAEAADALAGITAPAETICADVLATIAG